MARKTIKEVFMLLFEKIVFIIICAQLVIMTNNRQNRPKGQNGSEYIHKTRYLMISLQYTSLLLVFISYLNNNYRIGIIETPVIINYLGITLMLFGLLIRIISMKQLGKYYSTLLFANNDHHLIKTGIYKYIRHPIYLGDLILYFGFCLALSNFIIFLFIMSSFVFAYLLRIKQEEKMMQESFSDEYTAYIKKTKKLIPFIF
jgi:protein-S-isoprenylcysteine O-methyltransferase Ste14